MQNNIVYRVVIFDDQLNADDINEKKLLSKINSVYGEHGIDRTYVVGDGLNVELGCLFDNCTTIEMTSTRWRVVYKGMQKFLEKSTRIEVGEHMEVQQGIWVWDFMNNPMKPNTGWETDKNYVHRLLQISEQARPNVDDETLYILLNTMWKCKYFSQAIYSNASMKDMERMIVETINRLMFPCDGVVVDWSKHYNQVKSKNPIERLFRPILIDNPIDIYRY